MDRQNTLPKILSGFQYTKDIAAYYFQVMKTKETQLKAFKAQIAATKGMYEKMQANGYRDNIKLLSPQLVAIIVDFWGIPNQAELAWNKAREKELKN